MYLLMDSPGMTSSLFDLSVFVSFEIKLNDLRFMGDGRSEISWISPRVGTTQIPLLPHLMHISLNGTDAGCKEQCEIFLDEKTALIICFIRKSEELVFAQAWNTLFFQNLCIIRMGYRECNRYKTKVV